MTKNISLSNEAYKLLKNIKIKNESFSEVIKRLLNSKGNLSELLDLYPELKDEDKLEMNIKSIREDFDSRIKRTENEMS